MVALDIWGANTYSGLFSKFCDQDESATTT